MSTTRPLLQSLQMLPRRTPCPPGACTCKRDTVLVSTLSEQRILLLTQEEETQLVGRLQQVQTLAELRQLQQRMLDQLGLSLYIGAGSQNTQGLRGLHIELTPIPGLCRKARRTLPAAVRSCIERHPEIAYALLDEGSLFAGL